MARINNISGFQGDTFSVQLTGYIDGIAAELQSYGLSGHIRVAYSSNEPLFSLSPVAVSNEGSGVFSLSLHHTGMSSIPVGIYFYDVERYTGSTVRKISAGKFFVHPEATR